MARILIVDDERDVATLVDFMLQKEGHSCVCLHDGLQALAALGLEPFDPDKPLPDLLIIDIMMPSMDGREVCARMRRHPRTQAVPILILSGKGGSRQDFPHASLGAARLDKPFDPGDLRRAVGALLGTAR